MSVSLMLVFVSHITPPSHTLFSSAVTIAQPTNQISVSSDIEKLKEVFCIPPLCKKDNKEQ